MRLAHRRATSGGAPSLALIGLAAMLWGTGGVAAKGLLIVTEASPIEIGFYRLAISASTLLIIGSLLGSRSILRPIWHHPARSLGLGVAMGSQIFYYSAVAKAGVAVATLIGICMAPPMVCALSYGFFREPLDLRTCGAMALSLFGTVLLIGWPGQVTHGRLDLATGAVLALLAACCYACLVLVSRNLAPVYGAASLIVIGFGIGALLLLPLVLWRGFSNVAEPEAVGLLAYLGLVPTALAYVLFFIGMRRASATASSIVSLLEPLTATLLGTLIFAERLAATGLIGGGLMIAGLLILQRGSNSRARQNS